MFRPKENHLVQKDLLLGRKYILILSLNDAQPLLILFG